jgi:hypothetical protein
LATAGPAQTTNHAKPGELYARTTVSAAPGCATSFQARTIELEGMNTPQVGDQPAQNDSDALLRLQKATSPVVGAQQITFPRNIERMHV